MSSGIKGKENEDKFFTVEFFGVTVIITAFVLLLCLFFGEKILFDIGREVQFFILGVFGYFAYPFLLTLLLVGVFVLLGKKPNKKRKGSLIMLSYLVFVVLSVMTIIANSPNPTDLNEYLSFAFESGRLGVNGVVAGGALFSLFVFAPVKYLGNVFTIILLALLTIFVVYFRIKYKKKHKNDKELPQPVQEQQPQVQPQVQVPEMQMQPQGFSQQPQGYSQPYQPQQNYPQNAYGQPITNNGYPGLFNGQPLNYGSQNGYSQTQGYSQPQGYAQPQPNYNENPSNISREDAWRILYGNTAGMPKNYSTEYQDSFNGAGYRRNSDIPNNQGYQQNGGSVSNEIPRHDMFNSYTYEDRSNEIEDVNDFSVDTQNANDYDNPFTEDEETKRAKAFFSRVKEQYNGENSTKNEETPTNQQQIEFDEFDSVLSINETPDDYSSQTENNREVEDFINYTMEDKSSVVNEPVAQEQSSPLDNGLNEYGKKLIENMPTNYKYTPPPIKLLKTVDNTDTDYEYEIFKSDVKTKILMTLETFGISTQIAKIHRGPAVTRFDIEVPTTVPLDRITKLQRDINLRVAAKSEIRMIAPVPNTSYVGIEVPNRVQETVNLKELLNSEIFRSSKPSTLNFALGKDVVGSPVYLDIAEMPHLLISGTTGSGKSVCLNTMILSLVYKYSPQELRIVIVDPKRVDLEPFRTIPHMLFGDIIEDVPTTNSMLTWAVEEMENRYKVLAKSHTKNIKDYNAKASANGEKIMPRIVIIMDEFADIMLQDKKGVGDKVCAIAQKARAAGIHLVLAAQRPSADIVEGPIKSNLPSRIVFRASSAIDSQVSMGIPNAGAEKLLGKGDCLYKTGGMFGIERVMGAYVSDEEMFDIIDFVTENNECYFDYNNWSKIQARVQANQPQETADHEGVGADVNTDPNAVDPLYIKAMRIGYEFGGLSASFLQRKMCLGYQRAARVVDWLTDNGYVTPNSIAGKKQMILPIEEFEERFGNNG